MTEELRPRTLGEILDGTAQLYRSHFTLFVGIAVMPRALLLVWQLIQVGVTHVLDARHIPSTAFTVGGTIFSVLLYFLFVGLGVAAINRAVSALYLGKHASIAESYLQVRPQWLRYVWIMFLSFLYAWGPTMVPYGAFLIVGLKAQKLGGGVATNANITALAGPNPMAFLAVMGVAGLMIMLAVPYGVWMSLRYAVAIPASIFENVSAHAALKRSVALTLKGRGRILVMFLMVGIVFWIIAAAFETPVMIPVMRAALKHQPPPLWAVIATQIINFIVYSVIGPVYGIAVTLFYYDERIRKEGFDIEWMMQRANLSDSPEVPGPGPGLETGIS